jgi:hypothetical protein
MAPRKKAGWMFTIRAFVRELATFTISELLRNARNDV